MLQNGRANGTGPEVNPLGNESQIFELLTAAAWRIRLRRAAAGAVRGALIALSILIPILVLREIAMPVSLGWCLFALFVFLTGGAFFGLLRRLPPFEVARQLDARFALKERLQSALEFRNRVDRSMIRALIKDASAGAARIEAAEAFPLRPPREFRYLVPLLGLAAGALWLPLPPTLFTGATNTSNAAETATDATSVTKNASDESEDGDEQTVDEAQEMVRRQPWKDVTASYKDTPFATEPLDFTSFLQSADLDLSLFDSAAGLPDLQRNDGQEPFQVSVRRMPKEPVTPDPKNFSQGEAAERITEPGNMMGSGDPHEPPAQGSETGTYPDPANRPGMGEDESDRQQDRDPKGSPGATSGRQTQAPERAAEKLLEKSDPNAKKYGGGEQPHDAPGGILPPWLQGPEDPHFQDAGLGDAEGTGRKSGQPGTGHAAQLKGVETARLDMRTETEFRISGQRQEGDRESYDSDLPGPGAKVPSRATDKELFIKYSQIAEEALNRERVPLAYREQVKRYFSAVEGSQ